MVGLELMGKFLKAKGYTVDLGEGARVIYQHFKREAIQIPKPLENFIYLLTKVKHEDTPLLEFTYHSDKRAYIITSNIINLIEDEAVKVKREVPHSMAALAALIASLKKYGSKDELYPSSGVRVGGRTRKAVLLPEGLVDEVLGYFRVIEEEKSEEEVTAQDLERLVVLTTGHTFDELKQILGWKEHKLTKALIKLEKMGVVYAKDGRYFVDPKKAHEKGFPIIGPGGDEDE